MNLEVTEAISEQDQKSIYEGLLTYNLERIEDKSPKDLGVYVRDAAGNIIAGLTGVTHGNWLLIKFLWVSESLRGKNIGSEILQQAEKTAKERGCKYAFLDTFSFQAPLFYQKHGYQEVFALEEYPLTGKRYYFTKNL
ncbi:MAG TPA: GNAT family N-acetyltransferase [Clostridia bacterium]|jgi:GNAT superfamily N-acetyltransferase|nr:GNAT family N-acetyltransferase [Clostridia bacterium]